MKGIDNSDNDNSNNKNDSNNDNNNKGKTKSCPVNSLIQLWLCRTVHGELPIYNGLEVMLTLR